MAERKITSFENRSIKVAESGKVLYPVTGDSGYKPREHPVAVAHPDYSKMMTELKLPRALMGGTTDMRSAGKLFLPQNSREDDVDYKNRLKMNVLVNSFAKAVKNMSSRPFSNPIVLENVPNTAIKWFDNIDKMGNDINIFCKNVFEDAMVTGISHILAEYPRVDNNNLTLADIAAEDIRPYLVHIKSENLIGWKSELRNGHHVLTQIRIKETTTVQNGKYATKEVEQIRVIEPFHFELWQMNEKDWLMIDEGITTSDEIPLATFYTNRDDYMVGEPPLSDLAHLNVAHWQSMSDYRTMLHISNFPLLFARMLHDNRGIDATSDVVVGPHNMVEGHAPESDLRYVEHGGQSISALKIALDDLKNDMDIMGIAAFMKKRGNITATESRINAAATLSDLSAYVTAMESTMSSAIEFMFKFVNETPNVSISIFNDFDISLSDTDTDVLVRMGTLNLITKTTMLRELKRRGLFSDDLDVDIEVTLAGDNLELVDINPNV